ncbi:hypothetical protein [Allosphingosinicella sp.]|uniref:hypothetical protein n=1 Tax=Allosphingosinicella sp. TaxID=2823234 RepID=UPI002FC21DF3
MFRIASPLPRPPILAALIVVGLYLSAASPAEAVEPVIRSTAASWSALDPSLAPVAILAALLGSAGVALRIRQGRPG